MSDQPTFQIPKEIIEPIINAHVTDAVIKALDGEGKVVSTAILAILNASVDAEGKPERYSSSHAKPWIDWVIGDCIRKSARAAIEELLTVHADKLKASLLREMSQKNSLLVKQLINGMVGAMTHPDTLKWRINVAYDEKR